MSKIYFRDSVTHTPYSPMENNRCQSAWSNRNTHDTKNEKKKRTKLSRLLRTDLSKQSWGFLIPVFGSQLFLLFVSFCNVHYFRFFFCAVLTNITNVKGWARFFRSRLIIYYVCGPICGRACAATRVNRGQYRQGLNEKWQCLLPARVPLYVNLYAFRLRKRNRYS